MRDYQASLGLVTEAPLAILRIPDLGLEVPVYATDSELHLNRGAGLIPGMGLPDTGGNVGIAGHRDGFFRVLKDVKAGQRIEVETRAAPSCLSGRFHRSRGCERELMCSRTVTLPTVTLVTCLPVLFSRPRTPAIHRARHL